MTEQPWADEAFDGPYGDSAAGTALDVFDESVHGQVVDINVPLTTDEARELTEHIRSAVDVVWVLVARAHAGRAWEALGYPSFAAYVQEEFHISRSRAYQLLDQAKVVQAIEAATPEGTELSISEAAARDLKSILGEVVPEVEARTAGLPGNEAAEVVEEIVEDYREKVREQREAREQAALEAEEAAMDRADRDGFSSTGGGDYTPPPPPPPIYPEDDEIDPAMIRRNVQAAYDLYSSLSALKSMPDQQALIDTIPVERRMQINDSLNTAVDWLSGFRDQWFAQDWQAGTAGEAGEDFGDDLDEDFDEDDEY